MMTKYTLKWSFNRFMVKRTIEGNGLLDENLKLLCTQFFIDEVEVNCSEYAISLTEEVSRR